MARWPLTGRAEELSVALTCARRGGIVLAGAAGVGKTRLAREVMADSRRRGLDSRYVVATASARSVPLGAFAEFAPHLGGDPLARISEVVEAVADVASGPGPPVVVIDDGHLLDAQSALVVHQIVRRKEASVVVTIRSGEQAPDAITAIWKIMCCRDWS